MKFSIIIPTLNEEKYLPILLAALQDQTHKDFEVLVVDGSSDDKTVEKTKEFENILDIKVLNSKIRRISVQRNLGAKKAKYDDLIFFDADVKPRNDFLEKLQNILNKQDLDCCSCWNKPISKNIFFNLLFFIYNTFFLKTMEKIIPSAVGVFIYCKKNAFNKVGGFNENLLISEDFDFVKRVSKEGFKYKFLINLQVPFSTRRLSNYGFIKFIYMHLVNGYYYFIVGKVPDKFQDEYDFECHK